MPLTKSKTSGIYKQEGKTKTSYLVMYSVRVADRTSKTGFKWKPKGRTFQTYDEALDFKVKNQNENRSTRNLEPTDISMEQLCKEWLAYKKPQLKPQTYGFYKSHIEGYIVPSLGHFKAATIFPAQIREALNTWEQKLNWNTLRSVYGTLNRLFKFGIREHDFQSNPMNKVERIRRGESKEVQVFTALQLNKILKAAEPGLERVFLTVIAHTGLRPGEMCGLLWDAVDLKAGMLSVKRSLTELSEAEGGPVLEEPKTQRGKREVKLPPDVVKELRLWKLQCPPTEAGFVFANALGKPIKQISAFRMLKSCCQRANVKVLPLKTFRHTFASNHVIIGTPLTELAKMIGHAKASFTLDVYGHFAENRSTSQIALANWIKQAAEKEEERENQQHKTVES
jgi:integrase